jgi:hypothetical protein
MGDFEFFSHVIVNGRAEHHRVFDEHPSLEPLTRSVRWRLYQIRGGT